MKIKDDISVDVLMNLLNDVIKNAIDHGGDPGGPYGCNETGLHYSMLKFLVECGLNNEWTVEKKSIDCASYLMFKRRNK